MWLTGAIGLHAAVALTGAGHVLLQDKRPGVQWGWILALALMPLIGVFCYLMIGTDRLRLRRERRRDEFRSLHEEAFQAAGQVPPDAWPEPLAGGMHALAELNGVSATGGNRFGVLTTASAFYKELAEAIDAAREQIWICFYIWRDDEVGRHFAALVTDAAARGVEVHLLVDEVGSGRTPNTFFDPFQDAGGHFSWTTTLNPHRNRWFLNLRNHRKIVVIDGSLAFTGGMNIGEEYLDGLKDHRWHDLQLTVRGPAVTQLAAVFADDWYFATREKLLPVRQAPELSDGSTAQLVAGGPDHPTETNAHCVAALINAARESLLLSTPYFVPDQSLMIALELAAARGVHVRLLVSTETDMGRLVILSRSYFGRLLRAGVEICEYPEDIHHTKLLLVDGVLSLVGSINLDVRSLHYNYEVALAIHDPRLVEQLQHCVLDRLGAGRPLDMEVFARRPVRQRLLEGSLRLLAPLL